MASRLGVDGIRGAMGAGLPCYKHGQDVQEQEMRCGGAGDAEEQGPWQAAAGRKPAPADAEELSGDRTLLPALAEIVQMLWPSHVLAAQCLSFPSCKLL